MFTYAKITTRPIVPPVPRHIDVLRSPAPWWKRAKAKKYHAQAEDEMTALVNRLHAALVSDQAQNDAEEDDAPEQVGEPLPIWVKLSFLMVMFCLGAAVAALVVSN